MTKLNYQEILEKLKEKIKNVRQFAYEDYEQNLGEELGEVREVEQYGGEGQGDAWYSVKHFINHDVYIKVDGWYQSNYGVEFEDWNEACNEVKPSQKTITVYE